LSVNHARKSKHASNASSDRITLRDLDDDNTVIGTDSELGDASVIVEDEKAWDKSFENTSREDIADLERIVLARMLRKRVRPLDFNGR
jgi:hypothetical protein